MGKADYLKSFRLNADAFICSILPGISHPQVQYSPGIYISLLEHFCFGVHIKISLVLNRTYYTSIYEINRFEFRTRVINLSSCACYYKGGMIYKAGGSNMQHVTSLSFLLLAYSNYLSHANHVVPCGETAASPALLKQLAKRQVRGLLVFPSTSTFGKRDHV